MAITPGYTYIIGSPTGTLYIGVTSDLKDRALKHKNGTYDGFSRKYNCTRLLYYEKHDDIRISIAREKQFKGWRREKKLTLIRTSNPEFKDLAATWGWKLITADERCKPTSQEARCGAPKAFPSDVGHPPKLSK